LIRSKTGKRLRGGVLKCTHSYESIISVENLLTAWTEFVRGKRKKADVQLFQYNLMSNILSLHHDLKHYMYRHGGYEHFIVTDPKRRDIHKASVRDRLLHHALYRVLYPYFDRKFIPDSYSCRNGKGAHRAMNQFRIFANSVSKNQIKTCWILKCDIKKFFASIDHEILLQILEKHIRDREILNLLKIVIRSFETTSGKGLPLGNLTSQLLVNVYMNELDQFVKHELRAEHYIRYADDFVLLNQSRNNLVETFRYIERFLRAKLALELHPHKVSINTLASGVDFLGWIHFPHHRVLRSVTKCRMFKGVQGKEIESPTVQSYLGLLKHGNSYILQKLIYDTQLKNSSRTN